MVATTESGPDEDVEYVPGLSYPRVAALLVAVAVLAAGITYWATRPDRPGDPTDVDIGFVTDMRTHHQQAVELSLIALGNGENPTVRGFATEILVRQNVELGLMAAELDDWDLPTDRRPDEAMAWMGHPVPWQEMPGLATDEQLAELRAAEGAEADALFLELMVEHHRGGIHMAEYAVEHASADDVVDLARFMATVQATEVNEMLATARREGLA